MVLPTGDGRGNGAFASIPIPRGTHVVDYAGERLSLQQFYERYPDGVCDFTMRLGDEWSLDASSLVMQTQQFSAVHMNHSRGRANVLRFCDHVADRISFYAAWDIKPGEELLYNYGRNYWKGREGLELP